MYVVAYYIELTKRNESRMFISKIFRCCFIVIHSNAWSNNLFAFTWPRGATYIHINMDIVNLYMFTIKVVPRRSWLERLSSKREVVGSSPTVGKNFLIFEIFAFIVCP